MTTTLPVKRFTGVVFRAHNPRWAYAPTSGEGTARHGGRFNRKGVPTLYTALDIKTAWMEAQQGMPFKAQPLTLVGYRVDCNRIVDLTDSVVLGELNVAPGDLACPWEDFRALGMTPPTWKLSDALITAGHHGALVPSLAPGTRPADRNLVLWAWADNPPCEVHVIDDFGRLPTNDASWS